MTGSDSAWRRTATRRMAAYVLAVLLGIPLAATAFPYGLAVYLAAVIGGGLLLFRWHVRHTAFRCPGCDHAFVASLRTLLLSPHMASTTLLRCPACERVDWCRATSRQAAGPEAVPAGDTGRLEPLERALVVQMWLVLAVYGLLWVNTWVVYRMRVESINAGPFPGGTSTSLGLFLVPLAALPIAVLVVPFYVYAARRGYRHGVYRLVTAILIFSLLAIMAAEYLALADPAPLDPAGELTTRAGPAQSSPTIPLG